MQRLVTEEMKMLKVVLYLVNRNTTKHHESMIISKKEKERKKERKVFGNFLVVY
jgi:hypothetical protein